MSAASHATDFLGHASPIKPSRNSKRRELVARRVYGVLIGEMAIRETPDISYVSKRVYAICFAKRTFCGTV